MANCSPAGTRVCPFNVASIAATAASGSIDRLANVSLRTRPPSR